MNGTALISAHSSDFADGLNMITLRVSIPSSGANNKYAGVLLFSFSWKTVLVANDAHLGRITKLFPFNHSNSILSVSEDSTIKVWNVETESKSTNLIFYFLESIEVSMVVSYRNCNPLNVAISNDDSIAAILYKDVYY